MCVCRVGGAWSTRSTWSPTGGDEEGATKGAVEGVWERVAAARQVEDACVCVGVCWLSSSIVLLVGEA